MARTKDKRPTCGWQPDEYGYWDTDCGRTFCFEADGPNENEFRYCCYCGKVLKVRRPERG